MFDVCVLKKCKTKSGTPTLLVKGNAKQKEKIKPFVVDDKNSMQNIEIEHEFCHEKDEILFEIY